MISLNLKIVRLKTLIGNVENKTCTYPIYYNISKDEDISSIAVIST